MKLKRKPKKTIPAAACSTIAMVAGNEKFVDIVIDDGEVREWVAIGWISTHDATKADYARYPVVTRSHQAGVKKGSLQKRLTARGRKT